MDLHYYVRESRCDNCNNVIASHRCFIDINVKDLEDVSIQNLNECLHQALFNANAICHCGGLKERTKKFVAFLMFDLYSLDNRVSTISLKRFLEH